MKEYLLEHQGTTVGVKVWFDYQPADPDQRGWVAEYWIDGVLVTDSEKVDHADMPRDPTEQDRAVRIATAHARHLAERHAKNR